MCTLGAHSAGCWDCRTCCCHKPMMRKQLPSKGTNHPLPSHVSLEPWHVTEAIPAVDLEQAPRWPPTLSKGPFCNPLAPQLKCILPCALVLKLKFKNLLVQS